MFEVIIALPEDARSAGVNYTRLTYRGRSVWKTKRAADRIARAWKGENLRDAWAQPVAGTLVSRPVSSDSRYTISTEFCGHSVPRYVLRFAGEFLGSFQFISSATMRAVGHNCERNGALVITEKRSN